MLSKLQKLALIGLLAIGANAVCAAGTTPEEKLEVTVNEVLMALNDAAPGQSIDDKRDQVLEILEQSFSFDTIIRGTLGRNWNRLSDEQKEAIALLITELLVKAYMEEFAGSNDAPSVSFKETIKHSEKRIEVPTIVLLPGKEINVNYRMAKLKTGWQVYDILLEGLSLVGNYRKQFEKHFQTKGADELIDVIKEKIQQEL